MMQYKNLNILVIDDDRVDILAIQSALQEKNIANPVYVAQDGAKALDMLRGQNGEERIPRPYLILLDLNMPRMNGIEFLQALRADEELHQSIVFVLTTSRDDRDKTAAYDHHIAGYLVKSEVGADFMRLVSLLEDFKLIVQFPTQV